MNRKILSSLCTFILFSCIHNIYAQQVSYIYLKSPGNKSINYQLYEQPNGSLAANENLPVEIRQSKVTKNSSTLLTVTIKAKQTIYYNFETIFGTELKHNNCQFYMPGFWYHRNMRSPIDAPSFHTSDSWQVREDRLSTPLTGIYDDTAQKYYTVLRKDILKAESLTTHTNGEVILSSKTDLGFTGFRNVNGNASLVFGFPYSEAPKTYIRKLTLAPSVQAFEKLNAGETRTITWEIQTGVAKDYSTFIADIWNYSFDSFNPQIVENVMSDAEAKKVLSNFFTESYVSTHPLKYFSGVHMRTDDCASTGSVEVGFVGRVLLNAFNALEYGEQNNNTDLVDKANSVFDSFLSEGFTSSGLFKEFVDYTHNSETDIYSIRRQSEGVFAILNYLKYEREKGRKHPQWEARIKTLLSNFAKLQNTDGSFPRKFDNNFKIVDASGGSTPSATLPLTMAYAYFKDKSYLASAKATGTYLEKELISKSDYFSSTLDANCEDKEASLYAATAMYYLSMVSKDKEKAHYIALSKQAAYFCLSWYYMWDVPFAQGQMLGDVGFKSRGWGNVSVENNHIDVFIFEFGAVLNWLAKETNEPRFAKFNQVIRTSMLQLMPIPGHMFDIGKVGYYPEVVQHTNWDYGRNGKGFYNDIFAPGWTVASLWQMLSPERVDNYFSTK